MDKVDLANHPGAVAAAARRRACRPKPAKPRQIEFSRLNLNYTVMSKRKLLQLVNDGLVDGWDDPRMHTLRGLRRRGFTPAALRLLIERVGVSKQNSVIDYLGARRLRCAKTSTPRAPRRMAVLDPLKLVLTNLPDDHEETLTFANHPKDESFGTRDGAVLRASCGSSARISPRCRRRASTA